MSFLNTAYARRWLNNIGRNVVMETIIDKITVRKMCWIIIYFGNGENFFLLLRTLWNYGCCFRKMAIVKKSRRTNTRAFCFHIYNVLYSLYTRMKLSMQALNCPPVFIPCKIWDEMIAVLTPVRPHGLQLAAYFFSICDMFHQDVGYHDSPQLPAFYHSD